MLTIRVGLSVHFITYFLLQFSNWLGIAVIVCRQLVQLAFAVDLDVESIRIAACWILVTDCRLHVIVAHFVKVVTMDRKLLERLNIVN